MVTRRSCLLGTVAAAGALVVGWSLMPVRQRLTGAQPVPTGPGQNALNGWVKIGVDNRVTVIISKSEMGQGVHTGLAMLLAEELDADWRRCASSTRPLTPSTTTSAPWSTACHFTRMTTASSKPPRNDSPPS